MESRRGIPEAELASIKRLGVVSLLGTTFQSNYWGPTVFQNKSAKGSVADWQIDRSATELTLSTMTKRPGLIVTALDRGASTSEELMAESGKLSWERAEQQGLDHILTIYPGTYNEQYPPGYGYQERYQFNINLKCIYAAYAINLYEVKTRRKVAWRWGGKTLCAKYQGPVAFKESFADYSTEEKEQLKTAVLKHLSASIPQTLGGLSLAPTQED
jgi:hypothetical protein